MSYYTKSYKTSANLVQSMKTILIKPCKIVYFPSNLLNFCQSYSQSQTVKTVYKLLSAEEPYSVSMQRAVTVVSGGSNGLEMCCIRAGILSSDARVSQC